MANLENLINDFISQLEERRIRRTQAVQITKRSLIGQIEKSGKVTFEQGNQTFEFPESELKKVWKNIK